MQTNLAGHIKKLLGLEHLTDEQIKDLEQFPGVLVQDDQDPRTWAEKYHEKISKGWRRV